MISASRISPVSGLARDGPMAHPIIGETRLVAAFRQLRQAIVDDEGVAARVDGAIVFEKGAAEAPSAEGGLDLQFDIARKRLDLVPGAAVGVEGAKPAQLSE